MEELFLGLLKDFGPLVGIIAFFVWRDFRREAELSGRIVALEEQQHNILLTTVEKTTKIIERNTVVMEQNAKVMEQNAITIGRLHEVIDRMSTLCPMARRSFEEDCNQT